MEVNKNLLQYVHWGLYGRDGCGRRRFCGEQVRLLSLHFLLPMHGLLGPELSAACLSDCFVALMSTNLHAQEIEEKCYQCIRDNHAWVERAVTQNLDVPCVFGDMYQIAPPGVLHNGLSSSCKEILLFRFFPEP